MPFRYYLSAHGSLSDELQLFGTEPSVQSDHKGKRDWYRDLNLRNSYDINFTTPFLTNDTIDLQKDQQVFDAWHYDGDVTDFEFSASKETGTAPDQFLVTDFSMFKAGLTQINVQKHNDCETSEEGFDGLLSTQIFLIERRVQKWKQENGIDADTPLHVPLLVSTCRGGVSKDDVEEKGLKAANIVKDSSGEWIMKIMPTSKEIDNLKFEPTEE